MDLTVVICLYNAGQYIDETMESLLVQTKRDYKLLVIDDCSTDDSAEIAYQYTNKFEDFKLISRPENEGTASVRNFALNIVETPLMLFFDADDIADPEYVEKLYSKITESKNYIAVGCYSQYIDSSSNKIMGGHFIGPTSEEIFKRKAENGKLILLPCSTIFRKEWALKAGGFKQEHFPTGDIRYQDLSEDLDLWSRMSDFYVQGMVMITLPKILFYYRKNSGSLSGSREKLFAMQHKMRFIKVNLKRRRKGLSDIRFTEYMETLSRIDKLAYFFKDSSAYHYRQAGFKYINKSYTGFLYHMMRSIVYNPFYIVHKIKSNFLRMKP